MSNTLPVGSWCPACGSTDKFTQDGLPQKAIDLGLWKCTVCNRIRRPVNPLKAVAVAAVPTETL